VFPVDAASKALDMEGCVLIMFYHLIPHNTIIINELLNGI
jgi:hypothetical protein